MSYLRYHHILLIGIIMEKCENVQKKTLKIFRDIFVTTWNPVTVTMFNQTGNVVQIINSK